MVWSSLSNSQLTVQQANYTPSLLHGEEIAAQYHTLLHSLVPPFGWASTVSLKWNISQCCPQAPSHAN